MNTNKTQLDPRVIFSNNLKRYLELTGKSQKEVANAIGVQPSTFCDWLNLRTYPRVDKVQALANYFGIKKSDLVEEVSDEEEELDNLKMLELFHKVPKEKRELVLSMIRAAIDNL